MNEFSTDIVDFFESMFEIQQNVMRCIMNGEKKTVKQVAYVVQIEMGKLSEVCGSLAGIQAISTRVTELEKTNFAQDATYGSHKGYNSYPKCLSGRVLVAGAGQRLEKPLVGYSAAKCR